MPLPDPRRSRVLLIGTSNYDADDLEAIPAVRNNLRDLALALQDPVYGWAREETIAQLHDAQDPDEMMRALESAAREAKDLLLVYFAGHGALSESGALHLCLKGTRTDELSLLTSGFSYQHLRAAFQHTTARKKVLILDCCFSGAAINQMAGRRQQLRGLTEIAGTLILTSAPANGTAAAPPGDKYTAFTGELLLLLTEGDSDSPEELTLRDIWEVLRRELVAENRAAPQLQGTNDAQDLGIARNPVYYRDRSQQEKEGNQARRRLRRGLLWSGVVAGLMSVVLVAALLTRDTSDRSTANPLPPQAPTPVSSYPPCAQTDETLTIISSLDVSEPIGKLAKAYGRHMVAGRCVGISVDEKDSGEAMKALRDGWDPVVQKKPQPDVWSPASQIWLPLAHLNAVPASADLLPEKPTSLIATTPLVIAVPQPMAEVLKKNGYEKIGWSDLSHFAADADNVWKNLGKPQWGPFRLGKTDPRYSTSGLNATVAAYFAATHTSSELTLANVEDENNMNFERVIEQAIVHYGDTTLTFMSSLRAASDAPVPDADHDPGLSYISAVTVEEATMIAYNLGYTCGTSSTQQGCIQTSRPRIPLVAFYPKDGMLFSDHPYIEMNHLSDAKKGAADDFLNHYLHAPAGEREFGEIGLRTHDNKPTAKVTTANGAIPDAPMDSLPVPRQPEVLDRILSIWPSLRKPVSVLLVLDTSGSMDEKVDVTENGTTVKKTKLQLLKDAAPALIGSFAKTDRVGLWQFSTAGSYQGMDGDHRNLVDIGEIRETLPGGTRGDKLISEINKLYAQGNTALYETTEAAVNTMRANWDKNAIDAVILLTDGAQDPYNQPATAFTGQPLLDKLKDPAKNRVRVFTIAYGKDVSGSTSPRPGTTPTTDADGHEVLQLISNATGGKAYDASDPTTIKKVLIDLASNF